LVVAAAGCDPGAVLELELLLPSAPVDLGACDTTGSCVEGTCVAGRCVDEGPWYSRLELSIDQDFVRGGAVTPWETLPPGNDALTPIPLGAAADEVWSCTSVVGDPSVERLRARIRYCRDEDCRDRVGPGIIEHWIEIEQPFHDGKRTYVRRRAPAASPDARCESADDCVGLEGSTCLPAGRCGCFGDEDCPSGHCARLDEGGRCTFDVPRCEVAGCIVPDRLLDGPNLCLDLSAVVPE